MILNNRVVFSDNGVLSDISVEQNNFISGTSTIPVVATQDYLYVGSDLPFNHRYVEVGTVNALTSAVSVELWDGNSWVAAVDVTDQTVVSGKTFAQSGHISWAKSKTERWAAEDSEDVTGLTSLRIYNLYWARFKFSADLTAGTSIKFVGQKFSKDADLALYYPELTISDTYAQWPVQPKTTWEDQHYLAAEEIVRDLKKKSIIYSASQILNWELFKTASVHKTASIIMNTFGKDWIEPKNIAIASYEEALNMFLFQIDANKNTIVDSNEAFPSLKVERV